MKKLPRTLALLASSALLGSVALAQQVGQFRDFTPVTDAYLNNPSANDWPQYRRTYNGWAHSPLTQINRGNVEFLQLSWSRVITGTGPVEMTPLVYNGIMYLLNTNSVIQAIDATNGQLIWSYTRPGGGGVNNTGTQRSLALYGDKLYYSARNGFLVALDARTGQLAWQVSMLQDGQTLAGTHHPTGPIAANGVIVTGRDCGTFGAINLTPGGCYVLGHDPNTGEVLWRVNTIARPGEPGGDSWGGLPIEQRYQVSARGAATYDPLTKLVYIGTGSPAPYPAVVNGRSGDALYSNATLAIDAETGKLVWFYQHLPGDDWGLEHVGERILIDTVIRPAEGVWSAGNIDPNQVRHVVWTAGENGVQFVLDRETGQFLWASELLDQNVVTGVAANGGVQVNAALRHPAVGSTVTVGQRAAKGWWPGTYSPLTNAVYQTLQNAWVEQTAVAVAGTNLGVQRNAIRAPEQGDALSVIKAINVSTGAVLWERWSPSLQAGSLVSTGGGLVFGGDFDRNFHAYNDSTGEVLWQTKLNSRVTGGVISYAVNGVQYIAVVAGGGSGQLYDLDNVPTLDPATAGTPTVSASVFVFALPPAKR